MFYVGNELMLVYNHWRQFKVRISSQIYLQILEAKKKGCNYGKLNKNVKLYILYRLLKNFQHNQKIVMKLHFLMP